MSHLSEDILPNFRFNEPQFFREKKVPKYSHSRMTKIKTRERGEVG